jgi:DNA polymerase-1
MLMSYAMQAGLNGHGMDELSERYLGHQPIPIKSLLGSGKAQITFDRSASTMRCAMPPKTPM